MANWFFRLKNMLLNLDDSLLDIEDSPRKSDVIDCVSNILLGFYEATLLVQASDEFYDFYEFLIKENRAKRALAYLKGNNCYSYDIEPFNVVNKDIDNVDISKKEISIFFFQKTVSIQCTKILGENSNDVLFYVYLTNYYFPNVPLAYEKAGGGGSTSCDILKDIQKHNQRFCLVIADSDKRYPGAPIGGTAKSIKAVLNRRLIQIGFVELVVHEVENLIPIEFVEGSIKSNRQARTFLSKIRKSEKFKEFWKYYDIKEGISLSKIEDSVDYYSFAKELYANLYGNKNSFEDYIAQLKHSKKKSVFPPIREDLLDKFIHQEKKAKDRFVFTLYPNQGKLIAEKIVEYACCRSNDDPINI